MNIFSKHSTISSRVRSIVASDIEQRGAAWLITLGSGECNDYAKLVADRASMTTEGTQHVRFETVARAVRSRKQYYKNLNK